MEITRFDKKNCDALGAEIEAILHHEDIEEEFDVDIQYTGAEFDDLECRIQLTARIRGEKFAKTKWDEHCEKFGLQPEMFGKEFTIGKRRVRVCGIRPEARLEVLVVNVATGDKIRCDPRDVISRIGVS